MHACVRARACVDTEVGECKNERSCLVWSVWDLVDKLGRHEQQQQPQKQQQCRNDVQQHEQPDDCNHQPSASASGAIKQVAHSFRHYCCCLLLLLLLPAAAAAAAVHVRIGVVAIDHVCVSCSPTPLHTSAVCVWLGRVIDFVAVNAWPVKQAHAYREAQHAHRTVGDLSGNKGGYWTTGYTAYDDHSGYLPAVGASTCCNHAYNDDDVGFFESFLMYKSGTNHYAACGQGGRWECDDYPNDDDQKTTHQIYISFANPEEVYAELQYTA